MPTRDTLKYLQSLPLELKVMMTKQRIREWVAHYGENGVCVSFSGGKDSTVLLHLVRELYPNVKAVFSDTGLEYPEIREFVKTIDNVDWVKPELTFREIVVKHGYPVFSKEISETIWYARKIVGGGTLKSRNDKNSKINGIFPPRIAENGTEKQESSRTATTGQYNCHRKMLAGVFRQASGREQVNFQ